MSVIGLRVGPYEIVEAAEVPETGSWYLARRTAYNRKQPSEILVRLMDHDADERERVVLQSYFDRLRKLEDSRIPGAVSYFEGHGAVAIQCVRGISFTALLELIQTEEIELSQSTALDIVIDLCEAVHHAHHRGLVHGCLSIDSLVLGEAGQLWVFGFGMGPQETVESPWIAPERVAGDPATARTDQWSIAAIASALVTGETPWNEERPPSASDTKGIMNRLAREWSGLARILTPMLESNPAHRYDSLQRARQELLALSRQQSRPADRRELSRKLHLFFATPITYESESMDGAPPTTPLDIGNFATPPPARVRSAAAVGGLIDEAVTFVLDDLLETLEAETDGMLPDSDPPSAPGYTAAPRPSEQLSPAATRSNAVERNTINDEIENHFAADTAVPESEPDDFDLGEIANVSFTNPGSSPMELGELNVGDAVDEATREPSLPTLDLDLSAHTGDLPPREKPLVVQVTPWVAAIAVIGMLTYLFLG